MNKIYLIMALLWAVTGIANAQDIVFNSEYNKLQFPLSQSFQGGISGDDYNMKKLTLFHGNSIVFETGTNQPDFHFNRMVIDGAGNVAIGTAPNGARFAVYHNWPLGNIAKNATLITSFAALTGAANANNFQENHWLVRNQAGGDWFTSRLHNGIAIDGEFQHPQTDTRTWWERDPYANIQSWGDQQNTYLTINQGNIGIGTRSPDARLTVKGRVHAEEIKVDLLVPAPDFVFEPTYRLKPLRELKRYVSANRHLPEIPSAKEMTKEGINLTELNLKLLQKVEELTLYLIEKDEQIAALARKVNKQSKVLAKHRSNKPHN